MHSGEFYGFKCAYCLTKYLSTSASFRVLSSPSALLKHSTNFNSNLESLFAYESVFESFSTIPKTFMHAFSLGLVISNLN